MPRRSETPAEREARDRVKQRYDAQLAAINDFFTRERRIEMLRADIATLEAEQGTAATKLVEATSARASCRDPRLVAGSSTRGGQSMVHVRPGRKGIQYHRVGANRG